MKGMISVEIIQIHVSVPIKSKIMFLVMDSVTKEISMKGIIGRAMMNASQNINHVMECVLMIIVNVMGGVIKRMSMKGIFGLAMMNASQKIKLVMECVMKIIANVIGGVIKRMSMKGIFKIVTESASAIKKTCRGK